MWGHQDYAWQRPWISVGPAPMAPANFAVIPAPQNIPMTPLGAVPMTQPQQPMRWMGMPQQVPRQQFTQQQLPQQRPVQQQQPPQQQQQPQLSQPQLPQQPLPQPVPHQTPQLQPAEATPTPVDPWADAAAGARMTTPTSPIGGVATERGRSEAQELWKNYASTDPNPRSTLPQAQTMPGANAGIGASTNPQYPPAGPAPRTPAPQWFPSYPIHQVP